MAAARLQLVVVVVVIIIIAYLTKPTNMMHGVAVDIPYKLRIFNLAYAKLVVLIRQTVGTNCGPLTISSLDSSPIDVVLKIYSLLLAPYPL